MKSNNKRPISLPHSRHRSCCCIMIVIIICEPSRMRMACDLALLMGFHLALLMGLLMGFHLSFEALFLPCGSREVPAGSCPAQYVPLYATRRPHPHLHFPIPLRSSFDRKGGRQTMCCRSGVKKVAPPKKNVLNTPAVRTIHVSLAL